MYKTKTYEFKIKRHNDHRKWEDIPVDHTKEFSSDMGAVTYAQVDILGDDIERTIREIRYNEQGSPQGRYVSGSTYYKGNTIVTRQQEQAYKASKGENKMTRYSNLYARQKAYQDSVRDRAKKLCKEAGLDPELLGIHPHNAMVSYNQGKPWRGVDYGKVRKVLWLTNEKQWAFAEIVDRYYKRKQKELGYWKSSDYFHKED